MSKNTEHLNVSELLAARATQVQRGGARAAVLGVNDGLVSTLCIVVGVAAAGGDTKAVLLAGFAGVLAGAISMAAGEWISVKAQVELFEGVLTDLKTALKEDRKLLIDTLAHTFAKYGMLKDSAHEAANDIAKNDSHFRTIYAAQVIGVNPDELGSPWAAAGSSFLLFAAGSLAPIAPWALGIGGITGIITAVVLTALGGLFVGAYTARSSGKSIVNGAIRQLLIIVFAAGVTYGIGHLFGVVTA